MDFWFWFWFRYFATPQFWSQTRRDFEVQIFLAETGVGTVTGVAPYSYFDHDCDYMYRYESPVHGTDGLTSPPKDDDLS